MGWTQLLFSLFAMFNTAPAPVSTLAPTASDSIVRIEGPAPFLAERAPFVAHLGDMTSIYPVMAMTVLPGQTLPLAIDVPAAGLEFVAAATAGMLASDGPARWTWTAPETPGLYPITLSSPGMFEGMTLNVFVVHPFHRGPIRIDGYDIGTYPVNHSRHATAYAFPKGFIEVTAENESVLVAPHFVLAQFQCKQGARAFPKFVALREPLLVKLESALEAVNRSGIDAPTFTVMSGFRTPSYNHGLGNVEFSRHTWGDASDVFVDQMPRDGVMDDLDGDGRHGAGDARVLAAIIDGAREPAPYPALQGGLGTYGKTTSHGPFVHVDARGFRARWVG